MTNEYLDFLLSGGDLWPDFSRVLRRHRQERPQVPGRPPRHQRPGHLQGGDHHPRLPLHHPGPRHPALLPLLLREGGAGVRESGHLQTGPAEEGRSLGPGPVLHPAVHRQVLVCGPQDRVLRGPAPGDALQGLRHCQRGRCLLLQSEIIISLSSSSSP